MIDPVFVRDRTQWQCRLATARLGTGSIEYACATASEAAAIIRRLDSPRMQKRLFEFRRAAEPYAGSAAVREFDAKYRDLIRSTSA
ncbi:MAG: hypothetical protein LC808_37365 [Actinobacteria bacterium]|nr:hypothetical protein [Actinomycetota bacterium]